MHELAQHQASGLGHLARTHSARLVAIVRHSDDKAELPLLWRLCLTWVKLGYPVTVLDEGTYESDENPGLAQLLEFPQTPTSRREDASAWTVLPAAQGLKSLSRGIPTIALTTRMQGLFADDGVVIVYGNASTLVSLFKDRPLQPLMVVSSAPDCLVTSYVALKHLLSAGQFRPIVVDTSESTTKSASSLGPAEALADCAKNFLGYELNWTRLQDNQSDSAPSSEIQRMALRVLESAVPLSSRWGHFLLSEAKMNSRQTSRSY